MTPKYLLLLGEWLFLGLLLAFFMQTLLLVDDIAILYLWHQLCIILTPIFAFISNSLQLYRLSGCIDHRRRNLLCFHLYQGGPVDCLDMCSMIWIPVWNLTDICGIFFFLRCILVSLLGYQDFSIFEVRSK
jgi:hypothetical protein